MGAKERPRRLGSTDHDKESWVGSREGLSVKTRVGWHVLFGVSGKKSGPFLSPESAGSLNSSFFSHPLPMA